MPIPSPNSSCNTEVDLEQLRPGIRLLSAALTVTPNAAIISIVVAAILGAVIWAKFGSEAVLIWLAVAAFVQVSRIGAAVCIKRRGLLTVNPALTFRLLLTATLLSGLTWGAALPLIGAQLPTVWQLLVLTVIGGLASGAISTLGNSLALLSAFIIAAVAPASIWLILQDDTVSRVAGVLAVLYAINLSILGRGTAKRARELAQLAYENTDLARDLRYEKQAVDDANRELRRALNKQRKIESELREHRDGLEEIVAAQTADLVRAKENAEAASRAKSDFLTNVSHELRTPMHAILGFASIGERKAGERPQLQKYLRRIHESGHRLLLLVNDLLDLSKLESGRIDFRPCELDVLGLIEEAYAELESLFDEKHLRLHVERERPDRDYRCYGDRALLLQVITNLLGNAIRFSPSESRIIVHLAEATCDKRDGLILGFRDYGAGVPASELETVFDEFVQSTTTRTGARGTGLGLSICKRLVIQHTGRLWAETTEQGALFRVWLPAAASESHSATSASARSLELLK